MGRGDRQAGIGDVEMLSIFLIAFVFLFFVIPAFNVCWDWWVSTIPKMFDKK